MSGILLLICCILCGFCVGLFLQRREKDCMTFVEDLLRYIDLLRVNIDTERKSLAVFDGEFISRCGKQFSDYRSGTGGAPSKRTGKLADEFFDGVVACNNSQQLAKHLDYYKAVVAAQLAEMSYGGKRKGLYVKLGLLLGAMVGLLFL